MVYQIEIFNKLEGIEAASKQGLLRRKSPHFCEQVGFTLKILE